MKPTPLPGRTRLRRSRFRRLGKAAVWVLGIPAALLVGLYIVLLITPIPLPFLRDQVRDAVLSALGPESQLELGGMALAVEGGTWPVLRFSPVVYTDLKTGAKIRMEALEVGFSPVRAVFGQPGATVTMVGPHIQVIQDLFGPRVTSFEVVPDPAGGSTTVRVLEGKDAFPRIGIGAEGIEVQGSLPEGSQATMRSDNDWLVYNLEAAEQGMAQIVAQAQAGRFSRLTIRDGVLDMNDALYGFYRTLTDLTLDMAPSPDGSVTRGTFSATFDGSTMQGSVERRVAADGTTRLRSGITNIDFSVAVPFVNDQESMVGILGAGAVSIDVGFDRTTGKLVDGRFDVDMTGMDFRLMDDLYPIASSIISVDWEPAEARFTMAEAGIRIGNTSAKASGVFRLGLDETWGPTVGVSMNMTDVSLYAEGGPPEVPFTEMTFKGWSAPLYGALGIESFVAKKPGAQLAATGRVNMLRNGMGVNMEIGGEGITADDLKRLWPYFMSGESRDWFIKNIPTGEIISTTMRYNFPVGALAMDGEEQKPLPPNSMAIDILAKDVAISPMPGMKPIALEGETRLTLRDARMTFSAAGARYPTPSGDVTLSNAAFTMSPGDAPGASIVEFSGDVTSGIPSLIAIAKEQQPEALAAANLPLDLESLAGIVDLGLVATIMLDDKGAMTDFGYAINGTVTDFGSAEPIEGHIINGGQLTVTASQDGYRVAGQANVDSLEADVVIQGRGETPPELLLSSTLDVADLKSMGFDVSEFLSGKVKFVARPMPDGTLQMAVDIADAALTINDLGITKAVGVPGQLNAAIRQDGTLTDLSQVRLEFGSVELEGTLKYDTEKGLQSANFTKFALSDGDSAEVALAPIDGGYELRLRGEQLDLKPMLNRFFKLGEGTGGPQASAVTQTIVLDAELDRALGFYRTTAYDVDLDLRLKGTDMQRATLRASFGGDRSISVATNQAPEGRTMSVAFNDLGTLLRFVNVYPNLEGGAGTLVMRYDNDERADFGTFAAQNFSIVDEDNVADIVGNHRESQQMIAAQNKLEFSTGEVNFIRRRDRVEITDGMVAGAQVGGTLKGYIYTDAGQYDLTGTYIPMFGLSRAIQKVPLFGLLLAGEEGDGIFGITFAVRGDLESPKFQANPLSVLAVGPFRRIFEYRARELPRAEE